MLPRQARLTRRHAVLAFRQLALAVVLALALLAAGCGDGDTEPDESLDAGDASLTVVLDADGPDGEQQPETVQVECDEDESEPGCRALAALSAGDFSPPPAAQACTEIFGGPDVVTIEGTLAGEEIDVELTRANGCEIDRFDRALPLLEALFPGYRPGSAIAG